MKIYAMDTCFYNELGNYPLPVRCEMAEDLGLDGLGLTLWNEQAWSELEETASLCTKHRLEAASIYLKLDLDDPASRDRLLGVLPLVPPGCAIELGFISGKIAKSSPEGDAAALALIAPMLEAIDPARNPVCLYAHLGFWLERHSDALRLLRQCDHPALGWTFSVYHWFATQEGGLRALLAEEGAKLRRVNFSGTRRLAENQFSLEPLDLGTLDLPAIFGQILNHGYAGPVGIQGFRVAGDVYGNLRRSQAALCEWHQRLTARPHWADLVWRDPLA